MNWASLSDFLAMGGYGLYVWGSFGMVALTLAAEVTQLLLRRKALLQQDPFETDSEAVAAVHTRVERQC
ncbi:MAG: heme exporter protein CcmD [Burkholderiaceae bacterium]